MTTPKEGYQLRGPSAKVPTQKTMRKTKEKKGSFKATRKNLHGASGEKKASKRLIDYRVSMRSDDSG